MENIIKQANNSVADSQTPDNKPSIKEGQTTPKVSDMPLNNSSRPVPPALPEVNADQETSVEPPANKQNIPASLKPDLPAPEEINEIEQEPPEEIITPKDKMVADRGVLPKKQNSIGNVALKKNFEQILEVGLSPTLEEKVHHSHQKDAKKILKKIENIKKNKNNTSIKISSEVKKTEKLKLGPKGANSRRELFKFLDGKKTAVGAPNLLNPKATMLPEDNIDPSSEIAEENKTPFAIPKISPEPRKETPKQTKKIIPEKLSKIIPDRLKKITKRKDKTPAITPINYLARLNQHRNNANRVRQEHVAENLLKILDFAQMHQKITNDDVERLTGVKDDQATKYLNKLVKQGKLVRFGSTKNIFYKPVNNR